MGFGQAAIWWNRAVSLQNPTASAVMSVLGASVLGAIPKRVYEDVPEFLYLGNNIQLSLPPGSEYGEGVPALSVALILKRGFFTANALIRTEDLPRFAFLGMRVPCSAQAMLNHLTATDGRNVTTSTEQDRWTIYYGRAVSLLFLPAGSVVSDPSQSELAMIEFLYSLPFDGRLSPNVETALEKKLGPNS